MLDGCEPAMIHVRLDAPILGLRRERAARTQHRRKSSTLQADVTRTGTDNGAYVSPQRQRETDVR